ncbi:hypothetical protein M011DRAFT_74030 [Sporormia fimetaria CBS 119925]|uniref:Uncharacterized protein n=1 Tax=Sporormia fimetaria CBS 119925 TaxID=1340428 RepID=A0A6A6V7B7_9PLEO|nr:hypothetical protein M011DRAFT_74030 [Sporormia fimetaria CBS 119925]
MRKHGSRESQVSGRFWMPPHHGEVDLDEAKRGCAGTHVSGRPAVRMAVTFIRGRGRFGFGAAAGRLRRALSQRALIQVPKRAVCQRPIWRPRLEPVFPNRLDRCTASKLRRQRPGGALSGLASLRSGAILSTWRQRETPTGRFVSLHSACCR